VREARITGHGDLCKDKRWQAEMDLRPLQYNGWQSTRADQLPGVAF